MSGTGKVILVGAGCGDYDLITLRGKKLIERCDVIVYDSLIDDRILSFAPENAERICVGKRAGHHSETQDNINKLLVDMAAEGKTVVRLKGGDPFVFGRGGEEALALRENDIEFSVVPGISSAIAVPELAGIPVTHRQVSRSLHIITGHTSDEKEDFYVYTGLNGTIVFLMGLGRLDQIAQELIQNGKNKNTPVAIISNGASANQRIIKGTLENIAKISRIEKAEAPAVIVVGEVADFDLRPTEKHPLSDVMVTVTDFLHSFTI